MNEIDVHSLSLKEAKDYIEFTIRQAQQCGSDRVKIIHGYSHGQKIKDWIRNSQKIQQEVLYVLPDFSNSGVTILYLKKKIK